MFLCEHMARVEWRGNPLASLERRSCFSLTFVVDFHVLLKFVVEVYFLLGAFVANRRPDKVL